MSVTTASNNSSNPFTYKVKATFHPLVQVALARLSDEDRDVLAEFKAEFPNLIPEEMAKVANSFMLYRSRYVQKAREADPNGNQAAYSIEAAVSWKHDVAESQKARYRKWHFRVRAVWNKMYPKGFPSAAITKKTKHKKQKPKAARNKVKKRITRTSTNKKFQPLPSPPVSDDADYSARADSEETYDSMSENDPRNNEEHLWESTYCQRDSCKSQSQLEQCVEELLTPVSMVRELSPERSIYSVSSMPAFCDSDANVLPEPGFGDIRLSELNDDCPSIFTDSLIFSSLPSNALHSQEAQSFFEQTSTGWSPDFQLPPRHSLLIPFDEINFLSDSEIYLSLSSVPSLSSDLLYTDHFSMPADAGAGMLAQDLW